MANSVNLDQTAPIRAVCSGSTLFASILNSSVVLGKYLQPTTSADDIFRSIFFLALEGLKQQNKYKHNIDMFNALIKIYEPAHESLILNT